METRHSRPAALTQQKLSIKLICSRLPHTYWTIHTTWYESGLFEGPRDDVSGIMKTTLPVILINAVRPRPPRNQNDGTKNRPLPQNQGSEPPFPLVFSHGRRWWTAFGLPWLEADEYAMLLLSAAPGHPSEAAGKCRAPTAGLRGRTALLLDLKSHSSQTGYIL